MADYAVEIDVDNLNTSHAQIVDLVGADRTVLDIGCWTGDTARKLIARGCTVSGVEMDPAAAAVARTDLKEVVVMNLDKTSLLDHFEPGSFDAVVLGDVLEHLMDPVGVLQTAASLLVPGGRVVISIPNVTHGSLRLALLQGRWRYTSTGLLDATHIRFFSRAGLVDLVREAGLVLDELRGTLADPLTVEVQIDERDLPEGIVEWVRHQPDALVYQFVLAVRAPVGDEAVPSAPAVVDVPVPEESVRQIDWHTAARQRDLDRRHELLTVRDHIIGLEATATAAENRSVGAVHRAQRLRNRLSEVKQANARLRKVVAGLDVRLTEAEALRLRTHVRRTVSDRLRGR